MRRKLLSHLPPRPLRVVVVAVIVSLALPATAIAAAGDLDPTFSGDGRQRTNFGAGPSAAEAGVRQADGKIVAVGQADDNFLVARYNLDGSLDPSFSGDGRAQTNFTGSDGAVDVARQGNKIVVVGFSTDNNGTGEFALARYNPDGSLDTSFSGDGKQTTAWGVSARGQPGWRSKARQDRRGRQHQHPRLPHQRLRARPLQPQRVARHELLRRRQADDRARARGVRLREPGGDPGGRQDRRGRVGR